MKKLVRMLAVVFAFAFVLVGCGGSDKYAGSEYLGTWKATTAEYSGMSFDTEDLIGEFSLTLEANGNVKAVVAGESEKGEWEPTDDGILVKDSSDEMEFTKKDGNLVLDYEGVTITFEKE